MRYFLPLTVFLLSVAALADINIVEEIVCKVNGDIITRSELEQDRKAIDAELRKQRLTGARLEEALASAVKNGLRDRIDHLLLIQKGKEMNLKIDADVTKRLAEIQRQVAAQSPELANPERFQQFVREQTGKSFEDYRLELSNQLIKDEVVRGEIARKVQFKREELQAYYDEHKDEFQRQERIFLREILVSTQGKDTPETLAAAEKKAKDLVARARKGERFGELALANSDSATAQGGGALDPYEKGVLAPEIEGLVWNQERGYVTDPVKLPNGFLILRVDEHHTAGLAGFEEVEQEIQNKLFSGRMEPAMRAYLTRLREDAFLEIKTGYEDSGAAPGKDTTWTDPAQLRPETITKEEVIAQTRARRLLWMIPIPGTTADGAGTSSSR
jgi:parvulin-like peptidyl-prolyl isomerase